MSLTLTRRNFLRSAAAASAAVGAASLAPPFVHRAFADARTLTVDRRTIEVLGKPASVFGIMQPDGTAGLNLAPGERFLVDLLNRGGEETLIHWHGQNLPFLQDGFPDKWRPVIEDGTSAGYDYAPTPGTHWMHSHVGLQEQSLMAAPLIVRTAEDARADVQEVTVIFQDFSFTDPKEILAKLTGRASSGMAMGAGGDKLAMPAGHDVSGMAKGSDQAKTDTMAGMAKAGSGAAPPDLNDVDYDAFLANERSLDDPLVVATERNGRVRLRLINGSASSAFWIDLGELTGDVMFADGNAVEPVSGRRFPMTMGQRLDILLTLPGSGAFPIFATREGGTMRTGFILATPGAAVAKLPLAADATEVPLDLSLEEKLVALDPLPARQADVTFRMALTGNMAKYVWTLDNLAWPNHPPLMVSKGQRVVLEMTNETMMAHPMHLHGHRFQVIALDDKPLDGTLRDTILVLPKRKVTVAFDADNPGVWPLHCHNLYHMETGMLTEVAYDSFV